MKGGGRISGMGDQYEQGPKKELLLWLWAMRHRSNRE